ncbi:uncharacterized protein LOC114532970 [Dendronephthya gigantea]|uniref:uncharacterized protein LOC114532970 n=1 Tax=Dendronephthya gigantea TaxID=151771 RepID=UPI00106C2AD6|nr:uncharacterized protein LOC114532970 [Dendronephthya gigantea]
MEEEDPAVKSQYGIHSYTSTTAGAATTHRIPSRLAGDIVKEGLPPGTVVGMLSSNDSQKGQNMIYFVETYTSLFRCKGSALETTVMLTWKPRERNLYPVRIRARDNGSPPMWTEKVFNISVKNVNDLPRSIEISKNWVYENASSGTVVGELTGIDDDLGEYRTSNFSWKLLEDKTGNFIITHNKVAVRKELNYDTIQLCYIKVACSDQLSGTGTEEIPIYIINLIDPPTLDLRGHRIAENSKYGTVITQITSRSESSENLHFMISESSPKSSSKLGLSSPTMCERHRNATKFNITCHTNITVNGELDYEETSDYTLQIYVRNNDSSNFIKWNISVGNVNEKPEKLEVNKEVEVPEDIPSGIDIAFFMISDPDNRNERAQNHVCHIVNSAGQGQYFLINKKRNSLQVRENKSLNYEMQQSYLVTVQCTDSGTPPLSIEKNFTINVTDTDEPIETMTLSNNKVKENVKIGETIGILDAYDPDIHLPMTRTFSLVDTQHPAFALRGNDNEQLTVNGTLNFEKDPDYYITIRVTDAKERTLQVAFIIHVEDEPEAPTDIELYRDFMDENQVPGSFISNITVIDEDQNTVTVCTLMNDGGRRVTLNETNLLAGETNADYEQDLSHMFTISLECCDQTDLCIQKDFNISIKDVNEPPTDVTIDNLLVSENEKDILIGKVTIFDPDHISDNHCALTTDNKTEQQYLEILNKTLRLIKELDFEEKQTMMFTIVCTDNNNSTSFTKQFDLTVRDVNEAPNSGCENPLFVSPGTSFGTVIGSLNVTDPDNENTKDICRPKQRLTYTLISENIPFKIVDGYLFKSGHVDINTTYTIQIFIEDDGEILANDLTRIKGKKRSTIFNCTVISRPLIGPQIMLSSNEIQAGSRNATIIGYLEMHVKETHIMEYKLMKDECKSYPFVIEGNKLMLMLSETMSYERYIIPEYVLVMVRAKDSNSSGYVTDTQFAISIKDDVEEHKLICFSSDPVRLSDIATTKLGPVIIYHGNNTNFVCPSKDHFSSPPDVYECEVKLNMTASSKDFINVNFTNALSIDKDMFLWVRISVSEEVKGLDKLALDLRCFKPDRLFSFVEGSIEVGIAFEGVCENDIQPRNESLCKDNKTCHDDSLCTKVVNAEQRCVANEDQLLVLLTATPDIALLCEFETCLQETLHDPENVCLSGWNSTENKGREKRASDNPFYIDTLNIAHLATQKKIILSIAVWKTNDNGELKLVPRRSLPRLKNTGNVRFISTEDKCKLLEIERKECVTSREENLGKRTSTPLDRTMQVAVGTGSAIILTVILIVFVHCCRKQRRRAKDKRNENLENRVNPAFDNMELPAIPEEDGNDENSKKTDEGKYSFQNPGFVPPSQTESNGSMNIYEASSSMATGTYERPEQEVFKNDGKSKLAESFSSPLYAANDVIPVQNPQENTSEERYASVNLSKNEKTSTEATESGYETIPCLQEKKVEKKVEKKGWFRFSSKKRSNDQDAGQNKKMADNYARVNKNNQVWEMEVKNDESHYETVTLPDDTEIERWKLSLAQRKSSNGEEQIKNKEMQNNTEVSGKISDRKEGKHAYEDVPAIQEESKRKGLFRFSKAFKNNDIKDPKKENKMDRKNSTNSQSAVCASQNEMLNPRDKVKQDDPANKYPYYAEVLTRKDSEKKESSVVQGHNQSTQKGDEKAPYYHVLEENSEGAKSDNKDGEQNSHPYFILEQSDSSKEKKLYQSLHRELESPQPKHVYERYIRPEKTVSVVSVSSCEENEADV